MAKFCSVFVATFQYLLFIYVFKKPDLTGCGPYLASVVVLMGLFLILWTLPLYPRRLRKFNRSGNCLVQYLMAVFVIEYIMGCFWFPLETAVLALLPVISTELEEILTSINGGCSFPCELLKSEGMGAFMSYLMSFVLLLAAMHATRVINLNLISSGISPFVCDISRRVKKFLRGFPINIGLSPRGPKRSSKPDYCVSDEDDNFQFEPGAEDRHPTTESEYHYYR